MNTERETKEFVTTRGNKIVYKTYLTGREANEISSIFTKDAKVNMIGQEIKVDGFNTNSQHEATQKTIELSIVSLNGTTENIADRVLDLPNDDYQEIVELLNSLSKKKE